MSEARTIERGTDSAKRQAKEEVPGDRIKDAPALARELRWRVRHAAGYSSDDDGRSHRSAKGRSGANGEATANGISTKRKRPATDTVDDGTELFRNFKRPSWEHAEERPTERASRMVKARRPDKSQEWADDWVRGTDDMVEGEDGEEAHVETRRDVIVKVRRTAKGVERQRVERMLEEWVWDGANPGDSPAAAAQTEPTNVVTMGEDRAPPSRAEMTSDVKMEDASMPHKPGSSADTTLSGGMVNGSSVVVGPAAESC